MEQRVAIYNNSTGIAKKLSLLCRGEEIDIVRIEQKEDLLEMIQQDRVHMILLDIMLEESGWGEGIELIREIRRTCRLPIVVVSGQVGEQAKISALSEGADDYVPADDNPLVLLARIKSQLRRFLQLSSEAAAQEEIYRVGDLVVDDLRRKVLVAGREVRLTPTEYGILKLLVKEQGRVMSIKQIYEDIWNMTAIGAENIVAVHIRHIREKIEQNPQKPKYIKVVWGNGYMVS